MCRGKKITCLTRRAMQAADKGNLVVATEVLKEAIVLTNKGKMVIVEATSYNNLGLIVQLGGDTLKAKEYFNKALILVQGKLGNDNFLYHKIAHNLVCCG